MPQTPAGSLSIVETAGHRGWGWQARVELCGDSGADVRVVDPFGVDEERRVAWYLEEHLYLPLLDTERAAMARADIDRYGHALFVTIFADGPARALFEHWQAAGPELVEIRGSAAFHRLHWELLRTGPRAEPLAIRVPFVRVLARPGSTPSPPAVADPLAEVPPSRILLLTARSGPDEVPVRAVSRPLRDAVGGSVPVDLVRPGTLRALQAHLRCHPPGTYSVLHLDLHGSVAGPADRPVASLLFEADDEDDGRATANRLAEALAGRGIRLVVLTACQSGMPAAAGVSFAAELVTAGVPAVIGMRLAITVDAAARYAAALYGELARGADLNRAQTDARRALFANPSRVGSFGNRLDLRDWLLPLVHQVNAHPVRLRFAAPPTTAPATAIGDLPGRDNDIVSLERMLIEHRVLLLHGLIGIGKSALLHQLRREWQETGFSDQCLLVPAAERTVGEIEQRVREEVHPSSRSPVLLLDHIDHLTDAEVDGLVDVLHRATAALRIVAARRRPADGRPTYPLRRVDDRAASTIIELTIGSDRRADIADDLHFGRLLGLLDGHPGAVVAAAPLLTGQSPAEVAVAVQAGSLVERAGSGSGVVAALMALPAHVLRGILTWAPFSGRLPPDLAAYHALIDGGGPPPTNRAPLPEVVDVSVHAGLVEAPEPASSITIHPFLGCALRGLAPEPELTHWRVAHLTFFQHIAAQIGRLLDQHGDGATLATRTARQHLENVEVALASALSAGVPPTELFRAADAARESLGRPADRLALSETVCTMLRQQSPTIHLLICLERRAAMLGAVGRFAEARRVYDETVKLVQRLPELGADDRQTALAHLHHQYGILEHRYGALDAAAAELRAALQVADRRGFSTREDGLTWNLLGEIERESGRLAEAIACFVRALSLKERPVERRRTLFPLIETLIDQVERETAEKYYRTYRQLHAMEQSRELASVDDKVEFLYLTARLELMRGDWTAANRDLREALSRSDGYLQAVTGSVPHLALRSRVLHQLAVVALARGEVTDAAGNLERAAALARQGGKPREEVQILRALERLYLQQGMHELATGAQARADVVDERRPRDSEHRARG